MAESMEDIWLRKAREGDQDAFGCLVRAYEKRVFALTRRLCADPSDAEEAAQDAFLAVWQGLPNFRGEASFSTPARTSSGAGSAAPAWTSPWTRRRPCPPGIPAPRRRRSGRSFAPPSRRGSGSCRRTTGRP